MSISATKMRETNKEKVKEVQRHLNRENSTKDLGGKKRNKSSEW